MMSRLKSRFVNVTKQFRESFRGSLPFPSYPPPLAGSCLRAVARGGLFRILHNFNISRQLRLDEGGAILRPRATLCLNGVGHLFPARTNKGIDYVGYRAPRVVLNGRRFTRGMLARTASDNSGVDALNVCRLPEA